MRVISVAHDYICPWCYVGRHQAARLRAAYPELTFTWKGFELLPAGLPWKAPAPDPDAARRPPIPTRLELLQIADGVQVPARRRKYSNSRLALEGAEFAKDCEREEPYHDAIYRMYWDESLNIEDHDVLAEAARVSGLDVAEFRHALGDRRYTSRIVEFDAPANEAGIWHVPTFMFPGEWLAEQPYVVLEAAAKRCMARDEGTVPLVSLRG